MTHNQQLEEKQKVMEERMNSATSDMNRITEDYVKQKTVLKETDSVLDGLRRDNERLRIQVSTDCSVIGMSTRRAKLILSSTAQM